MGYYITWGSQNGVCYNRTNEISNVACQMLVAIATIVLFGGVVA